MTMRKITDLRGVGVETAVQPAAGQVAFRLTSGAVTDPVALPAGAKGEPGQDGANVLPTDDAVTQAVADDTSSTAATLRSNFAGLGALGPRAKMPTVRAPYEYLIDMGRPDHGATSNLETVNLQDGSSFFRGTQSGRVTTKGDGTTSIIRRQGFPAVDVTGKAIELSVQVEDWDNISTIGVHLGDSAFSNYVSLMAYNSSDLTSALRGPAENGQWLTLTLDMTSLSGTTGTPDLTQVRGARVIFFDKNLGTPVNCRVNHLAVFDKAPAFPNGVVSITFDDSYRSHFTVGQPLLAKYGMQGTFYTIVDVLGSTANGQRYYMTVDELKKLQDGGHEISAHANTSQAHNAVGGFTSLSPEALDAELREMKDWMVRHGFSGADHLALPQGLSNELVEETVRKYYSSQRGTLRRPYDTLKPGPAYNLHSEDLKIASKEWRHDTIDRAYENGTWLNFRMHDIVPVTPSPPGTTIPQDTTQAWTDLVEYIAAKGMPVRTVGDVLATV